MKDPTEIGDVPGEVQDEEALLDELMGLETALTATLPLPLPAPEANPDAWLLARLGPSEGRYVLQERARLQAELEALRAERTQIIRSCLSIANVLRHVVDTLTVMGKRP